VQSERTTKKNTGFTVVEVIIASAIFLILAVGLLPLFARSITNNLAGRETTDTTNYGRSRLEQLDQMSFLSASLAVPSGSTEGVTQEFWSPKDKIWKTGAPTSTDPALWYRTTRVRQFSVSDLGDDATFDTPLDGSAAAGQVHIKEIQVAVKSARSEGPLGGNWETRMRTLKVK
jgi:prepilin-type N-terminal cleavage/methylation domain-containing protein